MSEALEALELKEWNDERRKKETAKEKFFLAEDVAIRDGNVAVIEEKLRRNEGEKEKKIQI
jgi:hypothetical protein